ncbi:MAG: hypothetical protein ACTSRU_01900 [Candidatus Hodarchaeales archaeon]
MRSIIILTAILLVIFTAVPSSACTWTLKDPYFYDLSLTDDPARYLVTVVTSTNKSDRIELCYDCENRTLGFPGEEDRSIGYTDNFKRINTTYDYTLVAEITGSLWIVKDSNGTTIIHARLPKIVVEENFFFIDEQARIACLVVKDKGLNWLQPIPRDMDIPTPLPRRSSGISIQTGSSRSVNRKDS